MNPDLIQRIAEAEKTATEPHSVLLDSDVSYPLFSLMTSSALSSSAFAWVCEELEQQRRADLGYFNAHPEDARAYVSQFDEQYTGLRSPLKAISLFFNEIESVRYKSAKKALSQKPL